jgi:hypothetical protein
MFTRRKLLGSSLPGRSRGRGTRLAPLFEWAEMSYEAAMTVSFEKPCRVLSQDAHGGVLVSPERRQLLLENCERAS